MLGFVYLVGGACIKVAYFCGTQIALRVSNGIQLLAIVLIIDFHLHYGDLTDSSCLVKLVSEVNIYTLKPFGSKNDTRGIVF